MMPSDKQNIDWVRSFEAGDKWFKKLSVRKSGSEATIRYYARALKEFCGFVKMDPDEIMKDFKQGVASDLEATLERWGDNLDFFVDYLTDPEKRGGGALEKSSSAIYHAAVKSFFKYNSRVELKAPTPQFYSERIPAINFDDMKDLDQACDIQQRFFLRFLKDSGMSRGDAVNINYGHIRRQYEAGSKFVHIDAFRAKENVEYDTWIGPNTVDSLKTFLRIRQRRGEQLTDETPLFSTWTKPFHRMSPKGLSALFKRLTEKTGIIVRPHRIRKFFETYLALAKVHPVILKYWMGHKVATGKKDVEMRYIIPPVEEQRKLYMEAYKQIDLTPKPEAEDLLKAEIKSRLETMDPSERQKFVKHLTSIYREKANLMLADPEIKVLLRKEKTRTNGGSATDCQRIVTEQELAPYLAKGWRVQAVLPSGKVVISDER